MKAQEVVHGEIEFGDGRLELKSGVGPMAVVAMELGLEMVGAMAEWE